METNLIFVAGVHGVGKSTFCNELISRQSSLNHLSASKLISDFKVNAFTQLKQVPEISSNQDVLISAYQNYEHSKPVTLLDGHFCLFNAFFVPKAISMRVFSKLKVKLIILLTAEPETILLRVKIRDKNRLSKENITQLQEMESQTAKAVSTFLSVPLLTFSEKQLSGDMEVSLSTTMEVLAKCGFC